MQQKRKYIRALKQSQEQNRKSVKSLEGFRLHWCISRRNQHVEKDIQQDFGRRQKRLLVGTEKDSAGEEGLYDGTIKILKISSKAFWEITDDAKSPLGFPNELYTGVPEIRLWLRYASAADRERHLDMILNAYHGLFKGMNTWSTNEWKEPLNLSEEFIRENVLQKSLGKLRTVSPLSLTRDHTIGVSTS